MAKIDHPARRFRFPARRQLTLAALLGGAAAGLAPTRAAVAQSSLIVDGANSPFTVNADVTYSGVLVGNTGVGVLNQTGGVLTSINEFNVGYSNGSNGTYNLSGGSLSVSDNVYVGRLGTGAFTQGGGSSLTSEALYVGFNTPGNGTYALSGANTTITTGQFAVGYNGTGGFSQSDGSVSAKNLLLGVGTFNTGTGTYTLSGGSLFSGGQAILGLASGTTGTFIQSGGTFTIGVNRLTLGNDVAASGTYHLDGGTLRTDGVTHGSGTGVFNFAGGTLQASAKNGAFLQNLSTANVRGSSATANSGANFDTNGFNITVAQNLVHSTIANDPAADGGLTKSAAGVLTLTGANTYTGPTTVNADTLIVNGSIATASAVTVASGATLGGSGTVGGSVSINAGGTLAPGNSPGQLTIGGNLSLPAGSLLAIELGGTTAGSQSDQVLVAGQLTLGGNLSVTLINGFILPPGQSFVILEDTGSSVVVPTFANAPAGLYTDAAGDRFVVSLTNADGGLIANDVTLTAVPEPGTWSLLGIGGLGLLAAGQRARRRLA